MDARIVKSAPYGAHIQLRCKNHPNLRWSTKNISHIGARTLFYALEDYQAPPECDCPIGDLEPVPYDGPEVPE